jgi:predicted acyltransferase
MKNRLLSIDIMRGMTIFFMIIVNTPGTWNYVYPPLLHAKWHGWTPTDLVFPFFLFIVGVSMSISFSKIIVDGSIKQSRGKLIRKILRRTALIFLVGLFLNWFPFHHKHISELRILGVLQRIALAYGGAALLIVFLREKKLLGITAGIILLAYWGMMYFFGTSGDPYSLEGNFATWLDPKILGDAHVYKGFGIPFDPEGLVSTIPGIAHVLIGYFVGLKVLELRKNSNQKLTNPAQLSTLVGTGIVLTVLGLIWNYGFPINKPLWTSSYVLLTCGLGTLFLSILVWIVDHKKLIAWAYPFRVFGLNPLVSYALSGLFVKLMLYTFKWEDTNAYSWLYENIFQTTLGNYNGSFAFALCYTLFILMFALVLYKKNIVVKL